MGQLLSVVVPMHNEEDNIRLFVDQVDEIIRQLPDTKIEYLLVDDGSTDRTIAIVKSLHQNDERVHYISFSRNFGKEAALLAGIEHATGDLVTVMDADLQDPPSLLLDMVPPVLSGEVDVVVARRTSRTNEPWLRSQFSNLFYYLINKISETHLVSGERDFRVMSRQTVEAVLSLGERNRFSKGLFRWVGFRTKYVPYEYEKRGAGSSSWSFWSLAKYAIEGIVDFSQAPLMMVSGLGIFSFVLALFGAVFIIIRALIEPNTSAFGWPSMVVVLLGVSGLQLLSLGVVGRYISGIFLEVKQRPVYIIKEEA